MEKRMDRLGQLPINNQSTMLPEELQLIKRITQLTLFLGIMIGISLIFLVVELYNVFLTPRGSFLFVAPVVDELLLPLSFISFGAVFIIHWRLQILRSRCLAFRRSIDSTFSLQFGMIGINFIGIGCLFLLIRWGNLPGNVVFPIIGIWFLSFLAVYLYLPFRGKRRKAQR